jgi:hypothetical protein
MMSDYIRFNVLAQEVESLSGSDRVRQIIDQFETREEMEDALLEERKRAKAIHSNPPQMMPRANWRRRLFILVVGTPLPFLGHYLLNHYLPRDFLKRGGSGGAGSRGGGGHGGNGGGGEDGYNGGGSHRGQQSLHPLMTIVLVVVLLAALLGITNSLGFKINLSNASPAKLAQLANSDLTPAVTATAYVVKEAGAESVVAVTPAGIVIPPTAEATPTITATPTATVQPTPSVNSMEAVNVFVKAMNEVGWTDPAGGFSEPKTDPNSGEVIKDEEGKEIVVEVPLNDWFTNYAPGNPYLAEMAKYLLAHEWDKAREQAELAQQREPGLADQSIRKTLTEQLGEEVSGLPVGIVVAFKSRSGSYKDPSTPTPAPIVFAEDTGNESTSGSGEAVVAEAESTLEPKKATVRLSSPNISGQGGPQQAVSENAAVVAQPAEEPTPSFSAVQAAENIVDEQATAIANEVRVAEATVQAANSVNFQVQVATAQAAEVQRAVIAEQTGTAQEAYEKAIVSQWTQSTATAQAIFESYAYATPSAPQLFARPIVVDPPLEPAYIASPAEEPQYPQYPAVAEPQLAPEPQSYYVAQPTYEQPPQQFYAVEVNQPLDPSVPPLSTDGQTVYMPNTMKQPVYAEPVAPETYPPVVQPNLSMDQYGPSVPVIPDDQYRAALSITGYREAGAYDTQNYSYAPGSDQKLVQPSLSMDQAFGPVAPPAVGEIKKYLPVNMKGD